MGHASILSAPVLEQFIIQARLTRAMASLRIQGTPSRLLGDLQIHAFRVGSNLDLTGLRVRDSMPAEGTPVTLTVLMGEEVLTLESTLLAPEVEAGLSLLRLQWPQQSARLHRRRDVRVAAPDQSPIQAQLTMDGQVRDAMLVNLTESGVGLALKESLLVDLHAHVEVFAELPDGAVLRCPGEVRHLTYLEGYDYPTRLGIVLKPFQDVDLAAIHRFIQTRRTDRSQSFRKG